MSPLQIEILMHYHCRAEDWDGDSSILRELDELSLLKQVPERGGYELSPRGFAYVDKLLSIPLPVIAESWVFPQEETG